MSLNTGRLFRNGVATGNIVPGHPRSGRWCERSDLDDPVTGVRAQIKGALHLQGNRAAGHDASRNFVDRSCLHRYRVDGDHGKPQQLIAKVELFYRAVVEMPEVIEA